MKDLTHYFQSPGKVVSPTSVLLEDCTVAEKLSIVPNSSDENGSTSVCMETACEEDTNNLFNDKSRLSSNSLVLCKNKEKHSAPGNGRKRLKISKISPLSPTGNYKDRTETVEEVNKSTQNKVEKKFQNGLSDSGEQCGESDITPINSQVSPNAFQILMSTQQIFSSSNSGLKECCNGNVANDSSRNENRKKIKENLENMSKRKLEMEADIRSYESQTEGPKKKRRRIIMETDSENETTTIKSVHDNDSDEIASKKRRKRKKAVLKVDVNNKLRKSEKLCDILSSEAVKTVNHKNSNTEIKMSKSQNLKESKSTKQKFSPKQSDSSKKEYKTVEENNSVREHERNLKVILPNVNEENNVSNCSEINESLDDDLVISKKKSNILNYFNKVNNEERRRHSEKIKVTVDVHFPVVSTDKSKKGVMKKKSKRKGQNDTEDDIQLIETEVIEKPDLPLVKGNIISSVVSSDNRNDKNTPLVRSESVMKTQSDSFTCTPSPKEWKMRIRMPLGSLEHSPPHVKKQKVKLPAGKCAKNDSCIKIKSGSKINNITSLDINRKKKEKMNNKKTNSIEEISSNSSLSHLAKKKVASKSTPKKKILQNDQSEKEKVGQIESPKIKSAGKMGRLNLKADLSSKTHSSNPGKRKSEVKETTVFRKSLSDQMKPQNSALKCVTDQSKNTPQRKCDMRDKNISCEKNIVASTKRKSSFSDSKLSPVKKSREKKKNSSVKKTPIKNKTPQKFLSSRKETTVPNKIKEKDQCSAEVEMIDDNFVEPNENGNPGFPKEKEISNTGRSRRSCTMKNSNAVVSKKILRHSESLASQREKRGSSIKSFPGIEDVSIKSENLNSSPTLRHSTRKRTTIVPVIGISDEDSDDDYSSGSGDDFNGNIEDDFNSDSEGGFDDDSDENCESDDDSSFEVKMKKNVVSRRKKVSLDQKIVMQFLKKAKGTLNRKMALNDSKNYPRKPSCDKENKTALLKLAPVFMSRKGKKPDKATLLARKTFLQSGVPEVVKKMVEIQRIAEDQEHVHFPPISHVQQKENDAPVWNLADALHKFPSSKEVPFVSVPTNMLVANFIKQKLENSSSEAYIAACPPKIKLFREFLRAIKAESPDFPVYRTFKELYELSHPQVMNSVKGASGKKRKRRSNLSNKNIKEETGDISQDCEQGCAVWTAKYRPLNSGSILGNSNNVKRLKKWLELWIEVKENTFQKKFKDDESSSNEFLDDASDDECGRTILPKKTAILMGPNGSGKTMTVYTLAHELGYKVLEVNASAKRTGRRILSELLEATQSHQVGGKGDEKNTSGIKNFFSSKEKNVKTKVPQNENDQLTSKLSLLLIEDVDIVFEDEDEGFVSALSTLVIGSKRPVVLVTSDPSCPHLSRFLEQSLVLEFKPAPSKHISVWLQLVSLLEGVRVYRSSIENLLQYNGGDVRKTLLQLQFWVLSGGDNSKSLCESTTEPPEILDFPDDISNSSWVSVDDKKAANESSHPLHSNCLSTFLIWDPQILLFNRGKTWWNLPKLVGFNNVYHGKMEESTKSIKKEDQENENICESVVSAIEHTSDNNEETKTNPSEAEEQEKKWKSACSMKDLTALVKLSDALSVVERFSYTDCIVSEPDVSPWEKDPSDSLSLNHDNRPCEYGMKETAQSINNWLVASSITQCSAELRLEKKMPLTPVLQQQPPKEEMCWRSEQHNVSKQLGNAVAMLYWPQRRALATDYISSLRAISRLEQDRGCINDKRNNRFFHYLKGLGVEISPDVLDAACNVFSCTSQS